MPARAHAARDRAHRLRVLAEQAVMRASVTQSASEARMTRSAQLLGRRGRPFAAPLMTASLGNAQHLAGGRDVGHHRL